MYTRHLTKTAIYSFNASTKYVDNTNLIGNSNCQTIYYITFLPAKFEVPLFSKTSAPKFQYCSPRKRICYFYFKSQTIVTQHNSTLAKIATNCGHNLASTLAIAFRLRKQPARYLSKQDPDYIHLVVLQCPVFGYLICQLLYL